MANHLTVFIGQVIDSCHDQVNSGTLHPELHGQLHQTDNKLS